MLIYHHNVFFVKFGNEFIQRKFFVEYIELIGGSKKSVIIDAIRFQTTFKAILAYGENLMEK